MIKTIVVDDERLNLDIIEMYISKFCPDLELVASCD